MSKSYPIYNRRRLLRKLEKGWTTLERGIDKFTHISAPLAPYNPFYYLGQLAILLLIILIGTGLYLTLLYRPGSDRAYQSVVVLSANWFGSLMRTSHRYASDGLILVILLHALKMLFSDRFWGSRWLAWITGWGMLVLTWSLGVMGYWLVWDEPAQWITDWIVSGLQGPLAYSFFSPNAPSATFAMFVIVLFLHVFLPPLIGVGVIIHLLRLARAKYWTPRWLVGLTIVGLLIISLFLPVANGLPADFGRIINTTQLDWLYLGFLPVVERLGTPLTWGMTLLVVGLLTALPWLWRGQHNGPAKVIDPACTGCTACAHECPYDAIEMQERDDETSFNLLAIVKPDLCTGCGICVGACPDKAIELERLPSPVVRQDLQRQLGALAQSGEPAVTVYVCDRHSALGTLPAFYTPQTGETATVPIDSIPLLQANLPPRINIGKWLDENGKPRPVMTAVVPCTGMLHPNWASETLEAGGLGAIVISCPARDCTNREGPHWISKRLNRRRTLRKGNTHFLELAPGSRGVVHDLWTQMVEDEAHAHATRADLSIVGTPKAMLMPPPWQKRIPYLLGSLLVLVGIFLLSLLPTWQVNRKNVADSGIRLVMNHSSQRMAESSNLPADIAEKLPSNVDPATILGGQRFPLQLRLTINGEIVQEFEYEPSGIRKEGTIYAIETAWLEPDNYDVIVEMVDDGGDWRIVFDEIVGISAGTIQALFWQESEAQFILQ